MRASVPRMAAASLVAAVTASCSAQSASSDIDPAAPPSASQRIGLAEWDVVTARQPLAAGTVHLTVTNTGAAPHDLVLETGSTRAATRVLRPGETEVLKVDLPAGERALLWCSVAGHRAQGMEVELPVRPARTSG